MSTTSPKPAGSWRLRTRTLVFGRFPLLMGVVNVTPDSFSDGGDFFDAKRAVEHGLRLAAEGADVLDVGGESTRPGAAPVDAEEELRRVAPVLDALCKQTRVPVSIDTSKAPVAEAALDAGAEIINDVTALESDPHMSRLAVEAACGLCLMHMRGTPRTMQDEPAYDDVVAEVFEYLRRRRDALIAAGVSQDRIALDPGIGFGKTTQHNLDLLANVARFHALGCPVLVGHSRKRFIAELSKRWGGSCTADSGVAVQLPPQQSTGATGVLPVLSSNNGNNSVPPDRLPGTIAAALSLARGGVQILRVHDVAAVRRGLLIFQETGGLK